MNIHIYDGTNKIPQDETCYIIAKNGIYLKKKLDLIDSLTPVNNISFLEDIGTYAKINIPKIPKLLFSNIYYFFKEVYKLYKSEAVVLIYYNKTKKVYKPFIPEQEVSSASISYTLNNTMKDFILVGSIHSHGSMAAFHSGTDIKDEGNFDGLHITIGKVDEDFFDICASVAINGMRIPVIAMDYIDGIDITEYTPFFPNMFRPSFEIINGIKEYKNIVKPKMGYKIDNPENNDFKFNTKWLDNVKEKVYTSYYNNYNGNATYIFKDGKLIKIDGKDNETKINNNFKQNENKNLIQNNKNCGICRSCIHRLEKLKYKHIKNSKIKGDDLKNNYAYDFTLFDDFYNMYGGE